MADLFTSARDSGARPLPRPEILTAQPAHHGALDYTELEHLTLDPEKVLDFSVNSNPFGPSLSVRQALAHVPLDRYPDRETLALRRALSEHLEVPVTQILAGNGTAEIIWMVALAFVHPGDPVFVIGPTFGEYARAGALMGARIERWTATQEQDFSVDPDRVSERLERAEPRIAFLCNPNNPTGTTILPEVIAAWARAHPQTLFVVDEAYLAFAVGLRSALAMEAGNVLILRSMTKDHALAGLRLGYAVGPAEVIDALARVRPPWSVNAMAQAAGIAALADTEHLQQTMQELAQAKEDLVSGLIQQGLAPVLSAVHYFLVRVGDGAAFRRALLRRSIQVRDCASFGLPAFVRIATRRPEQNDRLLRAIREVN